MNNHITLNSNEVSFCAFTPDPFFMRTFTSISNVNVDVNIRDMFRTVNNDGFIMFRDAPVSLFFIIL